jgi:hypothetical protein
MNETTLKGVSRNLQMNESILLKGILINVNYLLTCDKIDKQNINTPVI